MSTPLANPRRTKLHAWPKRHAEVPERDQAAASEESASGESAKQAEKQTAGK